MIAPNKMCSQLVLRLPRAVCTICKSAIGTVDTVDFGSHSCGLGDHAREENKVVELVRAQARYSRGDGGTANIRTNACPTQCNPECLSRLYRKERWSVQERRVEGVMVMMMGGGQGNHGEIPGVGRKGPRSTKYRSFLLGP